MEAAAVLLAVSAALLLGAAWGTFWPLPSALKGFIVAMAGGALILSVVLRLRTRPNAHGRAPGAGSWLDASRETTRARLIC